MSDILIEQAIYSNRAVGGYQFTARSPGFREEWLTEAERICTGFGDRPADVVCPACVFAQPLDKRHLVIVQATDQGIDDVGRPGALAFHLAVVPRHAYAGFGGDPFALADRLPPSWDTRAELPTLSLPAEPLPPRTVEEVQTVLQRSDGPTLLGGAQALVDGGRLVFERPRPDTALVRALWVLLPTSTRAELWPASFAFDNRLGFDVVVVPRVEGENFVNHLNEEQAADYPEGRYELSLQTAAEAGEQHDLDLLFARRSSAETWRLGLILLVVLAALLVVMSGLRGVRPDPDDSDTNSPHPPAARPQLPPVGDYPALSAPDRQRLTEELGALAGKLGESPPATATAEQLLQTIDRRLGTPDRRRDPGPLQDWGPPRRQLQVLCWKHDLAEYDDTRLNAFELLQRLERKVLRQEGKAPRD